MYVCVCGGGGGALCMTDSNFSFMVFIHISYHVYARQLSKLPGETYLSCRQLPDRNPLSRSFWHTRVMTTRLAVCMSDSHKVEDPHKGMAFIHLYCILNLSGAYLEFLPSSKPFVKRMTYMYCKHVVDW